MGIIDDNIRTNTIISLLALKEYALETLKNDNLMHFCNEIKSTEDKYYIMAYNCMDKCITVNMEKAIYNSKKNICLYLHFSPNSNQMKEYLKCLSKKYKINTINIYMLHYINHELDHVKQEYNIDKFPSKNMSMLLKSSILLSGHNFDYYLSLHDNYLHEYQAEINSWFKTISIIEKNYMDIIGDRELEMFNMHLANTIRKGYHRDVSQGVCPVEYLGILSSRIHFGGTPYIRELGQCEKMESNMSDLLSGRNVPKDVLNDVDNIAKGKVKTKNLFKSIYLN